MAKLSPRVLGLPICQMLQEYFEASLQSAPVHLFSLLHLILFTRSENRIELLSLQSLKVYTLVIGILLAIQEVSVQFAIQ